MNILKQKQEDRADKVSKFEALTIAAEGKELSEAEVAQLVELENQITALDAEIASLSAIEERKKKIAAEKAARAVGAPQDNASEVKELSQYSYAKAFKDVHNKRSGKLGSVQGFEKEMHEEAQREADESGIQLQGNICIPSKMVKIGGKPHTSAPLTVTTEGTDVVQTQYGGLIPFLHPEPLVTRLGITVLSGLKGNVKWPRSTNDLSLGWKTEIDDAGETTPTFDSIDLAPNRLTGYVDVSLQMLVQSPFLMEQFIREKLQYAYAAAIDAAVINGSGTPPEPYGILNTAGVNIVSLGSSGGDITYGALIRMLTAPAADNAREGNSGWVFNTNGMASLALTPYQANGTEGNFLLKPETSMIWGHRFIVSNQIPSGLSEGGSSNLSAMIFSPRWASAILGTWGGVDILFDPYTQAGKGTVRFVVNTFADTEIEHPEEFAVIKDWNTSLPAAT